MCISSLSFHNIQKVQLLLCSFPQNTIALGCSAGMRGRVLGPPWRFSIYEYLHFIYMCVHAKSLSHVWLLATPWTIAHQAPLSMGFYRKEHWSGLPFPFPMKGRWWSYLTKSDNMRYYPRIGGVFGYKSECIMTILFFFSSMKKPL